MKVIKRMGYAANIRSGRWYDGDPIEKSVAEALRKALAKMPRGESLMVTLTVETPKR